jgi:hypothetical protein
MDTNDERLAFWLSSIDELPPAAKAAFKDWFESFKSIGES